MEFQGERIHRSNAITMRISTIQTIQLAGRIVIITQTNVIPITQLTAVAEHKITSENQAADGIPSAAISFNAYIFL